MNTLDGWCALNSSAGGPLLALTTIGGALAAGKSLISFPGRSTKDQVADRNKENLFWDFVLMLGLFTAALLIVDVAAYLHAYSNVRNVEKVYVDKLTDAGFCSIWLFFSCIAATAIVGSIYAFFWQDSSLRITSVRSDLGQQSFK